MGDWKNNKMDGNGIFTWPDGRRYEGEYNNDKKDGYEIFELADGKKYKVQWQNGKQNGEVVFIMIKTIVGENTLFEMEKELNG